MSLRIAVVGAGMAGLTAARLLAEQGNDVVVVEKARGAGGRMSTRRQGSCRFDHGAQYFTARHPRFLRQVEAWRKTGRVQAWNPRIAVIGEGKGAGAKQPTERFVAVPGMNSICKELADEQADCRFSWKVTRLERTGRGWTLHSADGQNLESDVLVVTTPPEQACALLRDPAVDERLQSVQMQPCWSLLMVLDRPLFADHDAAFVNEGPLSWVASQPSRPGRPGFHAWVLHASPDWSLAHLEASAGDVQDSLLEAARELPLAQAFRVESARPHRWRYALARQALDCEAVWLDSKKLALAGDWCHGSRVEGAFLSGVAVAERIMGRPLAAQD